MSLTTTQKAALKAAILADGTLNANPNTSDGNYNLAVLLNQQASPDFTVWKTNAPIANVGDNFAGTELAGLTTGNQTRLLTIAAYSAEGINPSLADRRAFLTTCFPVGVVRLHVQNYWHFGND